MYHHVENNDYPRKKMATFLTLSLGLSSVFIYIFFNFFHSVSTFFSTSFGFFFSCIFLHLLFYLLQLFLSLLISLYYSFFHIFLLDFFLSAISHFSLFLTWRMNVTIIFFLLVCKQKSIYIFFNCKLLLLFRYPVIICLENHCSLPQQQKMARYITSIFGDRLYRDAVDESRHCLPSPEFFKERILIKVYFSFQLLCTVMFLKNSLPVLLYHLHLFFEDNIIFQAYIPFTRNWKINFIYL